MNKKVYLKEKARQTFDAQKTTSNPYFQTGIILNSDSFHHQAMDLFQ